MHLPPDRPPERIFGKIRFSFILIATVGGFFGLFVSSNSGSLRVDATDKAEADSESSSILEERENFKHNLQPEKEEMEGDRSSESPQEIDEFPQEIFATLKPVPPLNLQETSPLNLSEIRGDRRTGILPVDEISPLNLSEIRGDRRTGILPVDGENPPVDETHEADFATDFATDFAGDETDEVTDFATDFAGDETDRKTGILPVNEKASPVDEKVSLVDEDAEIQLKTKETNLLEHWNLPPRNSAADLLASGSTSGREKSDRREERILSSEVLETSAENEENAGIVLTLNDAILLALENNRDLKNQYLDRIIERNQLEVAEDIFAPDFTPSASLEVNRNSNVLPFPNSGGLNLSANVALRLPNGANISLNWNTNSRLEGDENALNSVGQNLEFTVSQPLLRGAGSELNRLPIKRARLAEKGNILQLKSSLISTITNVITTYRGLVQSQQQLEIQEKALEDAKQRLEETNFLIELGRRARVEAVPIQQEIANGELAVLRAKSGLASQKLNLVQILDLERKIEVVGEDIQEVQNPSLNIQEITELALLNQPSYLQAQISIKTAELALLEAEDALRWQLDLEASYTNAISSLNETTGNFRAGINLSQELGEMKERKLQLKQSKIGLVQAQNNLLEERQRLEIEVVNAVRDVTLNLEEVKLARQATELAEEQLQIEGDKLALGAANASAKEVVRAQEDLVDARNAELAAKISYLNSLTNLWQTLGTTLKELGIEFDDGLGEVVFEEEK